jgi:predicted O-methyltransferase YrrM
VDNVASSLAEQEHEETPARQLLKLVLGFQISGVISVIAQLNVADHLNVGPRGAGDLATVTGTHPDALLRLLRTAVSLGIFDEVGPETFALNRLGECLRSDNRSVYGVALAAGRTAHTRPVELLRQAVTENRSVAKDALGMEIWEYWDKNPVTRAAVKEHLVEVNAAVGPALQQNYDLSGFRRIVDVGGNEGFFLTYLLAGAPEATGVLFDRPEVMGDARKTMAAAGLDDRVEFVGGDFLEGVPADGDLYVLKGILHDSSDESAHRVLTNCHQASRPGGTLIVLEGIRNDKPPFDPIVQLIDMNMLIMVNGRERSLAEFTSLLDGAGWDLRRTIELPTTGYWPFHVLEARYR